jgi:iron-sulfur cluster assembly protein
MIKVTKQAAEQIRQAAKQANSETMPLRLAAKINPDGSYEYGMGFDERKDNDLRVVSEGIEIIVSASCSEILEDAVLDFGEVEPNKSEFIFYNPNDPDHKPPKEEVFKE